MGYSTSRSAFENVKEILDILVEGGRHEFEAGNPNSLAYAIRQGIFSAEANEIEPYGSLNYRILVRPDRVICEPKAEVTHVASTDGPRVKRFGNRLTEFELIIHIKKLELQPGQEVIYSNFQGSIPPITKWAESNGFQILEEKPLHLAKL